MQISMGLSLQPSDIQVSDLLRFNDFPSGSAGKHWHRHGVVLVDACVWASVRLISRVQNQLDNDGLNYAWYASWGTASQFAGWRDYEQRSDAIDQIERSIERRIGATLSVVFARSR